jgi:hypothetical protein
MAHVQVKSGGRKICLLIVDSISSLLAPIIGGKYPQGTAFIALSTIPLPPQDFMQEYQEVEIN